MDFDRRHANHICFRGHNGTGTAAQHGLIRLKVLSFLTAVSKHVNVLGQFFIWRVMMPLTERP